MSYTFKQLSTDDIELLRELNLVFATSFCDAGTYEEYQGKKPSDQYLTSLLSNQNFIAVAAMKDDNVVAGLTAYELAKSEQERSEIYIYDLAVSEDHRRKGLATGLINELKTLAKKRGVWVIFVQADPGDTAPINLYTKLGKREDVHHFDINPNH